METPGERKKREQATYLLALVRYVWMCEWGMANAMADFLRAR